MVSTIPSGSCTHAFARNTLVPPQTTHGGTLCSWVGWTIFGRGGGWPRVEATFCGAVLLSDLFWNLSDSRRLAHMEGVALFGKRPRIFWQNRSQLQGQNVVCVCFSLRQCKFDVMEIWWEGGGSLEWLEHISFYFQGTGYEIGEEGREQKEVFFCWGAYMSC